jgi:hypothetical protein
MTLIHANERGLELIKTHSREPFNFFLFLPSSQIHMYVCMYVHIFLVLEYGGGALLHRKEKGRERELCER